MDQSKQNKSLESDNSQLNSVSGKKKEEEKEEKPQENGGEVQERKHLEDDDV